MNTLLLHPTDTLFFRDGRPISGSLAGHGAAWPLPTVLNAALHAALWRAGDAFDDVHFHRRGRSSNRQEEAARDRKFGSLTTAGPFPVRDSVWYFPRPGDAMEQGSTAVTLFPSPSIGASSLPEPLSLSVASARPPTKARPEAWWSQAAWAAYLQGASLAITAADDNEDPNFKCDGDFCDTEHLIGIGIDPDTGSQDGERFYSAHYLRLRQDWKLGAFAQSRDKLNTSPADKRDLVEMLFPNSGASTPIVIGGQQRLCSVKRTNGTLPMPRGAAVDGTRVKWVLLTPAIFPAINDHPGGWLPSWVDLKGQIQLLDGPGKNYAQRHKVPEGKQIKARLRAAIVPKAIPVSGYALPHEAADRSMGGAKPVHLAVPAGAVYYFEADTEADAQSLAATLNWHGDGDFTTIRNRRSTLMGEKGFGLGVCGTWTPMDT